MSLRFIAATMVIALMLSCAKSDENGSGNADSTPTPTPELTGPDGEPLVTFEPELLLDSARTLKYTVVLPQVRYRLPKDNATMVLMTVAIEAANEDVYEVLEQEKNTLGFVVTEALDDKSGAELQELSGRLALKEDIIQELQQRIKGSRGIKNLYYVEFMISTRN